MRDGEDAAESNDGWHARDKDTARALMNTGVKRSEIKALAREEDKLADKIEVTHHHDHHANANSTHSVSD